MIGFQRAERIELCLGTAVVFGAARESSRRRRTPPFRGIVVVRANTQSDVKRLLQFEPKRTTCGAQFAFAVQRQVTSKHIPALLDPQPAGARSRSDWISCVSALGFAILQRGQSVAVQRRIGIGGIRVEVLPDKQTSFAMRIAALALEYDAAASVTSPEILFQTKWRASLANHMFSPPPVTM